MSNPFIIQLHGAEHSGKTTVARLLCQLMPTRLPGLFLDGAENLSLATALSGQVPTATLVNSCEPLLNRVGMIELDGEEIDWRVADAVMTLGERLDVLAQGCFPEDLSKASEDMMTYGVKRLWGQYAWAVNDSPDLRLAQWLQNPFQPVGIVVLSPFDDESIWQHSIEEVQQVYPANKWSVLMNKVGGNIQDDQTEERSAVMEEWVYHHQKAEGVRHRIRLLGKLPLVSDTCLDPLGELIPPLQNCLYHLNMPFQPERL